MTYTIGPIGPRQFVEPGCEVVIYFYLRARFFFNAAATICLYICLYLARPLTGNNTIQYKFNFRKSSGYFMFNSLISCFSGFVSHHVIFNYLTRK